MNMHDANSMVKYVKSRKTQLYKVVTMCHDNEYGYGVRVRDLHSFEVIEWYGCTHDVLKRLLEEVRTDYNLFGFDRRSGRFFYAN